MKRFLSVLAVSLLILSLPGTPLEAASAPGSAPPGGTAPAATPGAPAAPAEVPTAPPAPALSAESAPAATPGAPGEPTGLPAPTPPAPPPGPEGTPPPPAPPADEGRQEPAPAPEKDEEAPSDSPETLSTSGSASLSGGGAQDPSENPVGGLVGNVDVVKASGAATAGIPIHVPPGRNGLSPRLVLRYASHGGQGPYGKGWSLELGRIERSTRQGVPRYTDDDGFRLILPDGRSVELTVKVVEPGTGATRWLPPFEEAFLRVVQYPTASPGVTPNTWEVWDRGGTNTSSARTGLGGRPPPVSALTSPRRGAPSPGT